MSMTTKKLKIVSHALVRTFSKQKCRRNVERFYRKTEGHRPNIHVPVKVS